MNNIDSFAVGMCLEDFNSFAVRDFAVRDFHESCLWAPRRMTSANFLRVHSPLVTCRSQSSVDIRKRRIYKAQDPTVGMDGMQSDKGKNKK